MAWVTRRALSPAACSCNETQTRICFHVGAGFATTVRLQVIVGVHGTLVRLDSMETRAGCVIAGVKLLVCLQRTILSKHPLDACGHMWSAPSIAA